LPNEDANKWAARELLVLVALFLVFFLLFRAVIPAITGVESPFTVVTSGSMKPTFQVGDLLIVIKANPYELKVGDIIVFKVPWSSSLIVHRIVRVSYTDSGPIFYTKGDANPVPDPSYRSAKDIYGKVIFRIPYLGSILNMFQSLPAKVAIVTIIAGIMIFEYVRRLGGKSSQDIFYKEDSINNIDDNAE